MSATAKVLVVDDEPIVVESCHRILSDEGIRVEAATTGHDGLRRVEGNGFDLILLDLRMPDTSGIDVLRRLKAVKPALEVIIITGYPSVDTAIEAMKLGALDYVVKPFTPEELTGAVRKGLQRHVATKAVPEQVRPPEAKAAFRRFSSLGLGRAIHTTTPKGKRVAIVGLGGVFQLDLGLFAGVIESLKRIVVPITREYGNHEVVGKEILSYLENNDKVVIVASVHMGANPGQVTVFRPRGAKGYPGNPTLELPQIGFPHVVTWTDTVGIRCEVVIIGVEPNREEGPPPVGEGLKHIVIYEALA